MSKEQTAVEWLESQIRYYISNDDRLFNMFNQAKEMEKQQIENAFNDGWENGQSRIETEKDYYYNKTFK
jgi:hypothetical protein